jgi:hypothetical protein
MLHRSRCFVVVDVYTAEALAEKLTEHTWCVCIGFRLGGYSMSSIDQQPSVMTEADDESR